MNKYSFDVSRFFNIQMFAEGEPAGEPATEPKAAEPKPGEGSPAAEAKYTDADLDRIIGQKFADWQKKQEKKISEAERLSKMTAEEKAAEQLKTLENRIKEYERSAARSEMTKEARAMLNDKNIHVDDALLGNLIGEDAETTKASVESFISLFNAAVEKAVKEKVKGEPPKAGAPAPAITKEQILAIENRAERQRMMAEHPDLF